MMTRRIKSHRCVDQVEALISISIDRSGGWAGRFFLIATTAAVVLVVMTFGGSGCGMAEVTDVSRADGGNRLKHETSPYLLQHADNPVDWYPWGEEAFRKAREEDKPVFLSIGYSTCHWCHVMEHESFKDAEVARLMNEAFVSVKVDREERPDIDGVYMTVCQLMTGSGGWPLTIIMTPEKVPFFAATYIPRENRFGRVGMLDLVPRMSEIWTTRREEVAGTASSVAAAMQQLSRPVPGDDLDESVLREAARHLADRFDADHGGFGGAPKFPSPHNLLFLLRHWKRTGEARYLEMVETTLQAMRRGGIYDHLGFGFHRYSTDERWVLPHFEKMLYDQALLTIAYVEAFQAAGNPDYAKTAEEIIEYVLRDMTSPEGGFYSAEDADSEGEEGKFYTWSEAEIRDVLDGSEADLTLRLFNVKRDGNFTDQATGSRPGTNVLYLTAPLEDQAGDLSMPPSEARDLLERSRAALYGRRKARIHPLKDDKILTDWNGLMIAALAKAGRVLDRSEYVEAAGRGAAFLLDHMRDGDGSLLHAYRDGRAKVPANLNDYAFMVWGLLELYEADFDIEHLRSALELNGEMLERFRDAEGGGFFFTPAGGEDLLVRRKEIYDGAIPSGNSVAMLNLLRLGRITGRAELEERAAGLGRAFARQVRQAPLGHTHLLVAVDFAVGPAHEVVISGQVGSSEIQGMLRALRKRFLPNKVVLHRPAGVNPPIAELAPFVGSQTAVDGRATAYVCRNYACELPTHDVARMLEMLGVEAEQR
jgi:uncharacterized protein YyaL (SSP411 family)